MNTDEQMEQPNILATNEMQPQQPGVYPGAGIPIKRKRGRPPKNRNLFGQPVAPQASPQAGQPQQIVVPPQQSPQVVVQKAETQGQTAVQVATGQPENGKSQAQATIRGKVPYVVHVAVLSNLQAGVSLYSAFADKDASAKMFMGKINDLIDQIYQGMVATGCLK